MIIPWQDIAPETLENLIKEFVLREGTDYGDVEISLQSKIDQVKQQLQLNQLQKARLKLKLTLLELILILTT